MLRKHNAVACREAFRPLLMELESRITPTQTPLTPPEIEQAYGFNQIAIPGGLPADGRGQTIAIIEIGDTSTSTITNALNAFDAGNGQYSLPPVPRMTTIELGTPGPATGNAEDETLLDVEWAHALAPGANIVVFEAAPDKLHSFDNFMSAVRAAAQYNGPLGQVSVISMSYGAPETDFSSAQLATYDSLFTTPPGHVGITFVASAGDDGAGNQTRYQPGGFEPISYPAASPNVVAVGGTTLNFAGKSTFDYPGVATSSTGPGEQPAQGESAWGNEQQSYYRNDSPGGGSGGGVSTLEMEPSYQQGLGQSGRSIPDVSLDADFKNSPVLVYGASGWEQNGGTSFSAPAWAALIAIADEARVVNGGSTLDGPTQTLPGLYQLPRNDYHDITQGNNGYPAGTGYDLATGLGTPIASRVVGDLWGQSPPAAMNDAYGVNSDSTLSVTPASSVLSNDSDPLNETLSASLVTPPANGTVILSANGSFTYTPNSGYLGADSFTYAVLASGSGTSTTATVTITVADNLPDLAPFTPSGWSGSLVASTTAGNPTTAAAITTNDTVFIDWAFGNFGSVSTGSTFSTELLVDGAVVKTWIGSSPLDAGFFTSVTDFSIGQLSAGIHIITVASDSSNEVLETNENNNESVIPIFVAVPNKPDLQPYTPSGWSGPLVASNASGDTVGTTVFDTSDTVYLNWAFGNQGNATMALPFIGAILG